MTNQVDGVTPIIFKINVVSYFKGIYYAHPNGDFIVTFTGDKLVIKADPVCINRERHAPARDQVQQLVEGMLLAALVTNETDPTIKKWECREWGAIPVKHMLITALTLAGKPTTSLYVNTILSTGRHLVVCDVGVYVTRHRSEPTALQTTGGRKIYLPVTSSSSPLVFVRAFDVGISHRKLDRGNPQTITMTPFVNALRGAEAITKDEYEEIRNVLTDKGYWRTEEEYQESVKYTKSLFI